MNTLNAQSFASDKLVFGEEEDLFNPTTYFNQGCNDFAPDDLFQDPSNIVVNFDSKNEEALGMKKAPTFDLLQNDSTPNNESMQADLGISADSFHFHFDRLTEEFSGKQEIQKQIGRTENGILYQINDDQEHLKSPTSFNESTFAKGTTSFTNFEDRTVETSNKTTYSATKVSVDESLTKYSETSKQGSNPLSIQDKISAQAVKPSSSEIDLSNRRDVVNKTVLRVMRRFFMQKFKEAYPKKFKGKEAKSKWYFEYIKKLVIKLFGEDHPELTILQTTMAAIINPKHMTAADILETGLEKEEFLTFYNTIYKYSHTRLASLFKVEALSQIYAYFFNGPMDQIISSEASVKKNSTLYSKAFSDFQRVFESHTGDSSIVLEVLCMNIQNSTTF